MRFLIFIVVVVGALLARLIHGGRWRNDTWPARVHLSAAWTLIVIGIVHVGATWAFFTELSGPALWFASGGIAMALAGSLNLLQRLYAATAPGLLPACVGGNLAMTILAATFVALAGAGVMREPQFLILLGLLLATTALSLRAGPALMAKSRRDGGRP